LDSQLASQPAPSTLSALPELLVPLVLRVPRAAGAAGSDAGGFRMACSNGLLRDQASISAASLLLNHKALAHPPADQSL